MKVLALAPVLSLVLAAAPAAQQPAADQPAQSQVFRSGASLVALNVTVTDGKKHITGLTANDFAVYEDGVQQRVQFFESKDVPIDLILLIDASSSMSDKMSLVHQAATGCLKALRPGDRGAVVTFSNGVNVAQELTEDYDALQAAVEAAQPRGATALHNAIYIALKQFGRAAQQSGAVRRQAIAVLSDGEDTSSLISFDEVLALARKSGVSVYTIGLQSKYSLARASDGSGRKYFSESDYGLRTLAKETGAQSFFPEAPGQLKAIYAAIAEEISSQYSIGYTPSNSRADGRYRRIVVRVESRPELRPRARTGYTAEVSRTSAGDTVHQQR